jgi:hypothetical protein
MINAPLAEDSKITATLIWDRPITRDAVGENTDPWTDTFTAGDLAALDMTLIDEDGDELSLTDSLGRASYSTSPVDSVEHFYFTIPATDVYGVRVKHLLSSEQSSAEFAFALWSTVIPEPMTLLAFAGLLIGRRRAARR